MMIIKSVIIIFILTFFYFHFLSVKDFIELSLMRIVWYIGDFYEFANQNGFRASVLGYKHSQA